MPHRYFTTEIADGTATLRGADAHHLARVMRGKLGDTVILCDGNAVEYTATITGFGPETVEFSVEPGYPSAAEPSVEVTLFVGYPKQDKLEQVIRHGVELGCAHFVPFFSRYCVAAPKKEEQKNERYNRIALKPPSSAAGAFCRMWPSRCPTSARSAAVWKGTTSCSSATSAAVLPSGSCWQTPSPPTARSGRSPSSPAQRAVLPPRRPKWPPKPVPRPSASAPAFSAVRRLRWPSSPPS